MSKPMERIVTTQFKGKAESARLTLAQTHAYEPSGRANVTTSITTGPRFGVSAEPGYSQAQFESALALSSAPLAHRAAKAKAKGMIGKEATKKLMDAAVDADA